MASFTEKHVHESTAQGGCDVSAHVCPSGLHRAKFSPARALESDKPGLIYSSTLQLSSGRP